MSTLIVEVCEVEEIASHPNADKIERIRVKNWWCISGIGQYKVGDKVVYVPPDAVLPLSLSDKWGITKYCVPIKDSKSVRVRASRFRGVSSFGTIQNLDDPTWSIGLDVKDYYGITKYEPPIKVNDGEAAEPVAAFHAYTSIEALGNFPNVFEEGEEVIVTEKIHGTNSRVGIVFTKLENGEHEWEFMAGSHSIRRKEFNEKGQRSKYWWPLSDELKEKLTNLVKNKNVQFAVILFGEIFGESVQDMTYGQKGLGYRLFDISIDGDYLSYDEMIALASELGIETVPILKRTNYSLKEMDLLVDGPTTVCDISSINEPFKGREGIVIKPKIERFDPILGGRAILKYVSVDYHERKNKNKTEDH